MDSAVLHAAALPGGQSLAAVTVPGSSAAHRATIVMKTFNMMSFDVSADPHLSHRGCG
jgi:hypothetical protein